MEEESIRNWLQGRNVQQADCVIEIFAYILVHLVRQCFNVYVACLVSGTIYRLCAVPLKLFDLHYCILL